MIDPDKIEGLRISSEAQMSRFPSVLTMTTKFKASLQFSDLPGEIMTEICLRLPTKSVERFRCVSKSYCSLLSEPMFAKRHVELALSQNSAKWKLLLSICNLYSVDLDKGIKDLDVVELDYPLKNEPSHFERFLYMVRSKHSWYWQEEELKAGLYKRNSIEIIGSCNGLLCIYPEEGGIFLYNPTTAESKRVPNSLRSKCENGLEENESFGFGYDPETDDYKVVKFVYSQQGYHCADVYSLKKDSWRRVSSLPYEYLDCTGVHLNSALHWVVQLQSNKRFVIGAFDLNTEEFREITLPDEASKYRFLVTGTLKGQLCVFYIGNEWYDFIWVMKEYGVESSWTKIKLGISYMCMTPLWWSTKNDGEVLVRLGRKLVFYNFECNTRRDLEFSSVNLHNPFEASMYVESLISPNSYVSHWLPGDRYAFIYMVQNFILIRIHLCFVYRIKQPDKQTNVSI